MEFRKLRERGFSLIELMIAVTIGLLIVSAMLANLQVSSASNRTNARVAGFQTNGRYATDFLRRELQHAGYAGVSWVNLTDLGTTGHDRLMVAAWASPPRSRNRFSAPMIPIRIRARAFRPPTTRAATSSCCGAPASTSFQPRRRLANTLYFRSEYVRGSVFVGPTRPANLQSPIEDHLLETDVYYISPWTNSATESPQVPALYRMTLGTGPAMTAQLIASGIENMQAESNIIRLKSCIAGNPGCVANDVPRLLLRLTRPEVDAILGPAQYRLRVAADDLYYWTVPFEARGTRGLIRLRITFGDCDYREKNSRKKAVCEAELH
jgi:prepilin-type N-terminal cleavage/methylation domain-containing protein